MLTEQAKEGKKDEKNHTLHSQAAAHRTNAKEGYIYTGTYSTVDTDHIHQHRRSTVQSPRRVRRTD